ncbi:MAG: hypothetical protein IPM42_01270 [Saprospiraceae bacterium]|nr:hypothetical protein [Saprospiraceae bacterium]
MSIIIKPTLNAGDSLSLYLFLLDECRISQEMTPYIREIYDEFNEQLNITAVFPNESSIEEGINTFVAKYNLKMKVITDYSKVLAKLTGATILPEAVIYNHSTNSILYRGRINDLYSAPGKRKHHISKHDLRMAISEVLKNTHNKLLYTQAIGCLIDYHEPQLLFQNQSQHE